MSQTGLLNFEVTKKFCNQCIEVTAATLAHKKEMELFYADRLDFRTEVVGYIFAGAAVITIIVLIICSLTACKNGNCCG
jgi:hypothetical protein